ncbi:MAG: alanine--tRNA ligase [Gammaproteobacteria bacterium]|nr:alanine--tRNA ligase [Gammaproteobacteria bacterium]
MRTAEIRAAFLDFFAARGHRVVKSSSLVPGNDPTLLFTNAGMVQFKDALTGRERLGFDRAASCQLCVRAGGKHNDLDNVGYTARHQTLFEMLGNFSFGSYFKEDAIDWAWEFVTGVLAFDRDRLWVTVHPTDDEARKLWIDKIGMPADRVIDHPDNFWAMGDTGPCGPDSEIFYDQGPAVAGGPPGSPEEEGDRFLEVWNLVFPQYDRSADGELAPLRNPGVDTGMGLERAAGISQGVHSNYENDIFRRIVFAAGRMARLNDEAEMLANPSLRVIADHIRSTAFLIAQGVMPGNEDRDYVLRRIIRRALRHGHKLGLKEPFFHKLVAPLAEEMGETYPEIEERKDSVEAMLLAEEERFGKALENGMKVLATHISLLQSTGALRRGALNSESTSASEREVARQQPARGEIPGHIVFQLYDTFGFPPDLTADVARELELDVDMDGFEIAMQGQRERSRQASRFDASAEQQVQVDSDVHFEGYETLEVDAEVISIFRLPDPDKAGSTEAPVPTDRLESSESGYVVLDRTPFYAESGGQVGDTGVIASNGTRFAVADTSRGGGQHLHRGTVEEGAITVGQRVTSTVDGERRWNIVRNHSATHLLHAALRRNLGGHVQQRGSRVGPEGFRFDFSHPAPLSDGELRSIELEVNARIGENSPATAEEMPYAEAMDKGAIALFGEKYGDVVRVLAMGGGYSVELCGGTHVRRTGDIGYMCIASESSVAAGTRRIEALTGERAVAHARGSERLIADIGQVVGGGRENLIEKVEALSQQNRSLQKELEALKGQVAQSRGFDLANEAVDVGGIRVLGAEVEGDSRTVLTTLDRLKDKLGTAVIVLAQVNGGRVNLTVGVTKDLTERFTAGDVIRYVGAQVGAKGGGGRPDMARGGGGDRPEALPAALASVRQWVEERVAGAGD